MTYLIKKTYPLLVIFTFFFSIVLFVNFFKLEINKPILLCLYYIISGLGYGFVYAIIPFLVLYLPFSLFGRNKSDTIVSAIYTFVSMLIMILLIIDSFVFSIYKYHLNWSLIQWFLEAGSDVFVFDIKLKIELGILLMICTFLPFSLVYFFRNKIGNTKLFSYPLSKYYLLFLLTCFVLSNVFYVIARKESKSEYIKVVECIPLFQSNILTKIVNKWSFSELDEIDYTMLYVPQKKMHYPLSPIVSSDTIPNYNIVMILIDSWSIKTFDKETTPNTFQFAQKAQTFKEHYSGANATIGGLFSLFYSMPYSYHAPAESSKAYPVLFEELKKRDYQIEIFSSANLVLENTVFGNIGKINNTTGNSAFEKDTKITDEAIDFIKNRKSKQAFFSLLFYDLAHAISIPEPYRNQFTPSWSEPNYLALNNELDPTPFFNLYRNCVYYIDFQIKRVLQELESNKLMDNTIIIITGDHGQEFNESKRNNWGHFSNYSRWQIQIPFILHDPSLSTEGITHNYVSTHYDIVPTLMHNYLGVQNPYSDYAVGKNLYDSSNRYPFWSGDFTIRTSLVFEDAITTVEHGPSIINITDRDLNPLPRSTVENRKQDFIEAQKIKEKFY